MIFALSITYCFINRYEDWEQKTIVDKIEEIMRCCD